MANLYTLNARVNAKQSECLYFSAHQQFEDISLVIDGMYAVQIPSAEFNTRSTGITDAAVVITATRSC